MCEAAILQSGIKVSFGAYSDYFRIKEKKKKLLF